MGGKKFGDPLGIDFSALRQNSGCIHPERLFGKLRHDAPLKLVGESGHKDKIARCGHGWVGGRRGNHRHAVALGYGPYLNGV